MKIAYLIVIAGLVSCKTPTGNTDKKSAGLSIVGTWKLITGTIIEKGDTTVTDYSKNVSFIKIINDTHFAFLKHNLNTPKDSSAGYDSGGGSYSLKDSTYTEHLEYCNEKEWEGHAFAFIITIHNDTLTQTGIEKVDSAGVNRLNKEMYSRLKTNQLN